MDRGASRGSLEPTPVGLACGQATTATDCNRPVDKLSGDGKGIMRPASFGGLAFRILWRASESTT